MISATHFSGLVTGKLTNINLPKIVQVAPTPKTIPIASMASIPGSVYSEMKRRIANECGANVILTIRIFNGIKGIDKLAKAASSPAMKNELKPAFSGA